jgi:hypothetical protein
MRYLGTTLALLITFAPALFAHDNWCGYDYTQLGVPDTQGNTDDTTLIDLNNRHEIIGADGFTSYLLDGGLFKDVIRVPGSTTTQARSINNRGEIVGSTTTRAAGGSFSRLAFHRDRQGRYRTFAAPNAILTDAWGISDAGVIVGSYRNRTDTNRTHGFILKDGLFETIDAPLGADTLLMSANRNVIVGITISDEGTRTQSFVFSDGLFSPLEIPDAFPFTVTVRDVNERGEITGSYSKTDPAAAPSANLHSFVLTDGQIVLIEAPFPNSQLTEVSGINNKGELVGRVYLRDGHNFGFTAVPRNCGGAALSQTGEGTED